MNIVLATNNEDEILEYKNILDNLKNQKDDKIMKLKNILNNINILTLNDIGFNKKIIVNSNDFLENAIIKAKEVHNYLKEKNLDYIVVSDDGGLVIDSLKKENNIYRYSENYDNYAFNRKKILDSLKGNNDDFSSLASFRSNIVLMYPDGYYKNFEGISLGCITDKEYGNTNLEYDCIFYSFLLKKVLSEATKEEKISISPIIEMLKSIKDNKNMNKILNKYNDCDMFSLTYDMGLTGNNLDNEIKISNIRNELLYEYNNLEEKDKITDFETLYKEIEEECIKLANAHKNDYQEDFYRYYFACNYVGKETKYSKPYNFFYNFYCLVGIIIEINENKVDYVRFTNYEVKANNIIKNNILKNNLIRYEFSYKNNVTIGGPVINFYFKLNDETKTLLSKYKSDYEIDIDMLEDLALYKNNELYFSSCTHEGYNSLEDVE